ncbi:MAG: hypothetical protein IOB84_12575 [Brevundimonas sp.]|nr:hypothetical protein [Brevundimonas sp.]
MCGCDDIPAQVYRRESRRSRTPRTCFECAAAIPPGTPHEVAAGLWDGEWDTFRTCQRCIALREHVIGTVPDACLMHGSMIDDCRSAIRELGPHPDGVVFGYLRRLHAVNMGRLDKENDSA